MKLRKFELACAAVALFWGSVGEARSAVAPIELDRAVYCLAKKGFISGNRAGARQLFGFLGDNKSYPGKRMLYVVQYTRASRRRGQAFSIVRAEKNGRQIFDIQNNSGFSIAGRGPEPVSFVSPPLGGVWTQQHLASAIEQIAELPRYSVSVARLRASPSSVDCQSYADPRSGAASN
jgi:hypothetical protein